MERNSFLSDLSAKEIGDLRERARPTRFRRGQTILSQDDTSDRLGVITSGRAKVMHLTDDGRELILAVRGPGDIVGELGAMDGEPRSATVTALDDVEALMMRAADFWAFLTENPHASERFIATLGGRMRASDRKRVELTSLDATARVARAVAEVADVMGEPAETGVVVALSQRDLAACAGVSREGVNKAVQTLRRRGYIATGRRRVTVLDLEALRSQFT